MNKSSLLILGFLVFFSLTSCTKHKAEPPKSSVDTAQFPPVHLPFNVEPNEAQKAELEKLRLNYGERLWNAQSKIKTALNNDQKFARTSAANAALAAGKSGKELEDAINNATTMTPEQKAQLEAGQKELADVSTEISQKVSALLTPEQREEISKTVDGKKKDSTDKLKKGKDSKKKGKDKKVDKKSAKKAAPVPKAKVE